MGSNRSAGFSRLTSQFLTGLARVACRSSKAGTPILWDTEIVVMPISARSTHSKADDRSLRIV